MTRFLAQEHGLHKVGRVKPVLCNDVRSLYHSSSCSFPLTVKQIRMAIEDSIKREM